MSLLLKEIETRSANNGKFPGVVMPGEEPRQGCISLKQLFFLFESQSRVNIIEGSFRSGKTHIALLRWVNYVQNAPPGDLLMMGKTYGTLIRNNIRPMKKMIGRAMNFKSSMNLIEVWDRKIYCYGAGTNDAVGLIQGMTCAGALGDELSLWPENVLKMLISRLSVVGAKFFGTTNPDAPKHWLKTNYIDRAELLGYMIFQILIDDNPFLPPEYVEQLKKEYTGLWYKRYILAQWAVAEGVVYDFYDDKKPYIIPRSEYPEAQYYVIGIDYGTQNPFVAGLYGVNRDNKLQIWKEAELYYCGRDTGIQKTDAEYYDMLLDFIIAKIPQGKKLRKIYPDPSAKSFIVLLKQKRLPVKSNVNNSVLDGIRNQARMLKSGRYAIGEECVKTRDEYLSFVWDKKAQILGVDAPLKENDHTKDEERYTLMEEFGSERTDYSRLTKY